MFTMVTPLVGGRFCLWGRCIPHKNSQTILSYSIVGKNVPHDYRILWRTPHYTQPNIHATLSHARRTLIERIKPWPWLLSTTVSALISFVIFQGEFA